jgi:hypothetical protein
MTAGVSLVKKLRQASAKDRWNQGLNMRNALIVIIFFLANLAAYATDETRLPVPYTVWSPWLAYQGQPPEEGAVGVLNMPLPERNGQPGLPLSVYWVIGWRNPMNRSESVPADTFLRSENGYKDINSGEQCRQVQLLVFEMQGEWALLYGRNCWAWASIRQEVFNRRSCWDEELISLLEARLRDHIWRPNQGGDESMEIPNRQGYTWSANEEFIQLPPGPLRSEPRDDARIVDRLPDRWIWRNLEKPIDKWPLELTQLAAGKPYKVIMGEGSGAAVPLRVLEMKGDWLRVQLAKAGTSFYQNLPGEIEGYVSTVACWDKQRIGWVRWRSPGPLLGTYLHRILSVGDSMGAE